MYTQENFKYDFPEQNINRVRDQLFNELVLLQDLLYWSVKLC